MKQQEIPVGILVDMYKRGDPTLWSADAYRDYLKMRRDVLAQSMNAFVRETSGT